MGMPAAALLALAVNLRRAEPRPGARDSRASAGRASSSTRRTWQARSILFYTPPTARPPDVPPARPLIGSPR